MALEVLLNPVVTNAGDGTILISAFAPRMTGPKPFFIKNLLVFFGADISFTTVPNVFATIASPHYIVAPFFIATTGISFAVNKVSDPISNQNANIYVMVHGKGTVAGAPSMQFLWQEPKDLEEMQKIAIELLGPQQN